MGLQILMYLMLYNYLLTDGFFTIFNLKVPLLSVVGGTPNAFLYLVLHQLHSQILS